MIGTSPARAGVCRFSKLGVCVLVFVVVTGGMLAGFFGMMGRVHVVTMRDVGMMTGFHVISGGIVLGRGAMVFRSMFMMLGGFQVVLFAFFRHGFSFGM